MPYADREVRKEKRREKRWADKSREQKGAHAAAQKKRTVELRREAIEAFGGKCMKCGFVEYECLQFDHIYGTENGGRAFRRPRLKYLAILRGVLGFTELQLLCANCHILKTRRNQDYLNCKKLGKRTELKRMALVATPRAPSRMKVWLTCGICGEVFLRPALGHEKRKFCSHKCSARHAVMNVPRWGHTEKRLPLFTEIA